VRFHGTTQLAQMVLKAPSSSVECLSNRDCKVVVGLFVHRKLRTGRAQIDWDVEGTAPAMVTDGRFDHHMAPREPWKVVFEGLCALLDQRPHCARSAKSREVI
jgi:hypothetical protein